MNNISLSSFHDELEKISSLGVAGLEAAGLGILAKPGIDTLRDRKASAKDKKHAKFETAGLGVLAAHPLYELGKAGLGALKHASVDQEVLEDLAEGYLEKISKMSRDMQMHANVDASRQAAQQGAQQAQRSGPRGVSMGHEHGLQHAGASGLDLASKPRLMPKVAPQAVGTATKAATKPGLLQGALGIFRKAL